MNKQIYRIIFNKARSMLMAVQETARGFGRSADRRGNSSILVRVVMSCLVGGALILAPLAPSYAACLLPQGGRISAGQGSVGVGPDGKSLTIQQSSQNAVFNFQCFGIGNGYGVGVNQPGQDARALLRDLGGDASRIDGRLTANGQIYILNPAGIFFGPNARIDVGALVATTRALSDRDFMSGNNLSLIRGEQDAGSEVVNEGQMVAGMVTLIADKVRNNGTIQARDIRLMAGDTATLMLNNGLLADVVLNGDVAGALVDNQGVLRADNGRVYLTVRGRNEALSSVVNLGGTIKAGIIEVDGGKSGVVNITNATLDVSNAQGVGGNITLTGERIGLFGTTYLNARGSSGGGLVRVGGDYQGGGNLPHATGVILDSDAIIDASATENGKGGRVILWSDEYTGFHGTILAQAGQHGGDGGLIETSSKNNLQAFGRASASAARGHGGTWLLDPTDITISSAADAGYTNTSGNPWTVSGILIAATVNNATINDQLNSGTSVVITTASGLLGTGNINVNANIEKSAGSDASLSLVANGSIVMASGVSITSTVGKLDVNMTAGSGTGSGSISLSGNTITTNGGNLTANATTSGSANALDLNNVTLDVGTGLGNLTGTNSGDSNGVGVRFSGNTTTNGTITVSGTQTSSAAPSISSGSLVEGNFTINNGTLTILGTSASTDPKTGGVLFRRPSISGTGSLVVNGTATGSGVAGSTITGDYGVFDDGVGGNVNTTFNLSGGVTIIGNSQSGIGIYFNQPASAFVANNTNVTFCGTSVTGGAIGFNSNYISTNGSLNLTGSSSNTLVTPTINLNSSSSFTFNGGNFNVNGLGHNSCATVRIASRSIFMNGGGQATITGIATGTNNTVRGVILAGVNTNLSGNITIIGSASTNSATNSSVGVFVGFGGLAALTLNNANLTVYGSTSGVSDASSAGIAVKSAINGTGNVTMVGNSTGSAGAGIWGQSGNNWNVSCISQLAAYAIKLTGSATNNAGVYFSAAANFSGGPVSITGNSTANSTGVSLFTITGSSRLVVTSLNHTSILLGGNISNSNEVGILLDASGDLLLNGKTIDMSAGTGGMTLLAGSGNAAGDISGGNVTGGVANSLKVAAGKLVSIFSGSYDAVVVNNTTSQYQSWVQIGGANPTAATTEKWYGANIRDTINASSNLNVLYRQRPATNLTVSASAADHVYDGTNVVAVNYTVSSGAVDGDVFGPQTLSGTATNSHVGNNYAVATSTYNPSSSGNAQVVHGYNAVLANPDVTVNITPRAATVTVNDASKVYDGTNASNGTWAVSGLLSGENVTGLIRTYNTTHAGTGLTITTTDATGLSGSTAGSLLSDYDLTYVASTGSTITPRAVTVSATSDSRAYDRTINSAAPVGVSGLLSGDTLTGVHQVFDAKDAGSRTLSVVSNSATGVSGSAGSLLSDYDITYDTTTAAGSITPASLSLTGLTLQAKKADGTTSANVTGTPSLSPAFAGDVVQLGGTPDANYRSAAPGRNRPADISGLTLTGVDAANYRIDPQSLVLYSEIQGHIEGVALPYPNSLFSNMGYVGVQSITQPSGFSTTNPLLSERPHDVGALSKHPILGKLEITRTIVTCERGGVNMGPLKGQIRSCDNFQLQR